MLSYRKKLGRFVVKSGQLSFRRLGFTRTKAKTKRFHFFVFNGINKLEVVKECGFLP